MGGLLAPVGIIGQIFFHFSKGLCEMSIYQNRWIQADHQREWVRIYSGMICSWNIIGHKFSIIFHVSNFFEVSVFYEVHEVHGVKNQPSRNRYWLPKLRKEVVFEQPLEHAKRCVKLLKDKIT
jgi:hypothetical protein